MATTIKQRLGFGFMGVGLALAIGACAPEDPPANPSFAKDVLPVMKAHCVRCHGANDKLNGDPYSYPGFNKYNLPPNTGYFDTYEDKMGCVPTQTTFCAGAKSSAISIKIYVHASTNMRMPPAPADPLSDWDLKLIDNWTSKTPPNP